MDMSLKPSNLIDFTSLFHRDGFVLKRVVGTTYSLHYETLLMLILALIYGPGANDAIDRKTDEISAAALLAAIRKIKEEDLLTVFCQADRAALSATGDEGYLLTLLDAFVRPVPVMKNDRGGFSSFHSKVWLAAFEKTDNAAEKAFRLIVTSRNLTSNRDFDAVAVFESAEKGSREVIEAIREQVGQLPPDFDDAGFNVSPYSFRKAGKLVETRLRECHSIFSPFLDAQLLDGLPTERRINVFSMEQEIGKLGKINEKSNLRFFMLNPDMNAGAEAEDGGDGKHFGLHAKLYLGDDFVILGSSNFTSRGLTQNREFNVKINAGIGEDELLNSVVSDRKKNESEADWQLRILREKSGMFLPYQSSEPVEEPSEADQELDKLIQDLACCRLTAKYDDAGTLSLSVDCAPKNAGVRIRWKPFLHGDFISIDDELCWPGVPQEHVCRIFVCEVEIDGADARRFQMLADLDAASVDLWKKRFEVEKSKIDIKDEIDFKMLCIEKTEDLYGRVVQLRTREGNRGSGGGNRMPQPPIFERLLELKPDQLKLFFEDRLLKRADDSSGLYDSYVEMEKFFGFDRDEEGS